MKLTLAGLAICLASFNIGNTSVFVYWCMVCAYWVINYFDGTGKTHD